METRQDKIIIYNEVIDVMRAITMLFKKKRDELRKKRRRESRLNQGEKNKFLEDEEEGGYTIEKTLLIEAWAKYRPPVQGPNDDKKLMTRSDIS